MDKNLDKEFREMKGHNKYKTNCVFCGNTFITETNTANEGICYECRCC